MDMRRLGLLRELADRGSVTAVAAALHLTPSAVSQQLKALEREAGVALTERSGRGLALTGAVDARQDGEGRLPSPIEQAEAVWADFVEQPRGEVTVAGFPIRRADARCPGRCTRSRCGRAALVCSDQDPAAPRLRSTSTSDHDIVVADASGVLPGWRERGLVITELMREPSTSPCRGPPARGRHD